MRLWGGVTVTVTKGPEAPSSLPSRSHGCWQEASALCHMSLPQGQPECPQDLIPPPRDTPSPGSQQGGRESPPPFSLGGDGFRVLPQETGSLGLCRRRASMATLSKETVVGSGVQGAFTQVGVLKVTQEGQEHCDTQSPGNE